jgi:hypothetical protein
MGETVYAPRPRGGGPRAQSSRIYAVRQTLHVFIWRRGGRRHVQTHTYQIGRAPFWVVAVTTIGHTVIPTDLLYKWVPEPISRRDVVLLTCWSRPPGHALLVLPACSRLRALGVAVFTSRSALGELGSETSTWLYGRTCGRCL